MEKTCKKCGLPKEVVVGFYKCKATSDGFMPYCKPCDNMRKYIRLRAKSKARGIKRIPTLEARALRERGLRWCPCCEQTKDLVEDFYTSGKTNGGYAAQCIPCSNALGRARPKEEQQKHYQKIKQRVRSTNLKKKFGITQEQYDAMATAQGGVCAICGRKDGKKQLAVDHNHSTGVIRALLCGACNPGIGFFKENPELCRKAATYLEAHKDG